MKRKASEDEADLASSLECELIVAAADIAAFAPDLGHLNQLAREWRASWMARLDLVRRAAALSNEQLHEEGRSEAMHRYGHADAPHLWPDPPSLTLLIEQSVRTDQEASFTSEVDAFATRVAEAKAARLAQLQEAKAASPPETASVRVLGQGLGLLVKAVREATELDKPVRERLELSTKRIARYRASCSVRALAPSARLVAVPPTRAGYEQILDFYRLTDASTYSFGRVFDGPQFFTDVRRNVAIMHATRGPLPAADAARSTDGGDRSDVRAGSVRLGDGSDGSVGASIGAHYGACMGASIGDDGGDDAVLFSEYAAVDGLGECYMRDHDAEFKLASALCTRWLGVRAPGDVNATYHGRITLWSKKALCTSCAAVVHEQLVAALPNAELCVRVDDEG
ncbi:hypothetical protein Ctob_001353 [Chrysochromulina tobinii]|uniref:Uncharacterized protein n=1 Tax=Chrysochromulina tobinii TaxID=1460289 RepID=A0A0M0JHT4_9EUKA|nr:hypothetical protein Ctob_001353 [Chrysochromulina tobinii]|eukprot:KOO26139.1 hypothetical protein Ctob_001353 [Chrysochromulina sp. CCMP291]